MGLLNDKYPIYFTHGVWPFGNMVQPPALVFSTASDEWNDFSLKTRFQYWLISGPDSYTSGKVHLAFQGCQDSPVEKVDTALKHSNRHIMPAKEFPEFYTIHLDMDAYRKIVHQHEPDGAEKLLLAMNDLVAIKRNLRERDVLPWYNAATVSKPFMLSFMRKAETFFAFHNADSILNGLESESIEGISNQLRLEFKLAAFDNPHILDFNFESKSDLPKRIAVIIGKNGVGKSQTLAHFSKSLLDGDGGLTDGNAKPPMINRLLAVSSPGETRNTFPGPRKRPRIFYKKIILGQTRIGAQSDIGTPLVNLARSDEAIKGKKRWDMFCEAIRTVVPPDEIAVRIRPLPRHDYSDVESSSSEKIFRPINPIGTARTTSPSEEVFPLTEMRTGGEQKCLERWGKFNHRTEIFRFINKKIVPLSSGQLTFIRFAVQACLHIENGTMVLFDEPETHLHPNYIADFVCLLDKLLAETGSFAILATHSAYFVREVTRSQVIVLRQGQDNSIEAVTPRLKTLGADIGAISSFVFEDAEYGYLLRELRDKLIPLGVSALDRLNSLEDELPSESIMYLRQSLLEEGR